MNKHSNYNVNNIMTEYYKKKKYAERKKVGDKDGRTDGRTTKK